jgi:hypothetical protein
MDRNFAVLPAGAVRSADLAQETEPRWILWSQEGEIVGVGAGSEPGTSEKSRPAERRERPERDNFIIAGEEATLVDLIISMRNQEVEAGIIVRSDAPSTLEGIVGVVGKEALVDAMADALEIFL